MRYTTPGLFVCSLLLSVALGTGIRAQDGPPAGQSAETKKLQFLVGRWQGQGTVTPPGVAPVAITATCDTAWLSGEFFLQRRLRVQMAGKPEPEELQILGYDPRMRTYRLWSFGPQAQEWRGNFEGTKLVLTEPPREPHEGDPRAVEGIGVGWSGQPTSEGYLSLGTVVPDSPAEKAGLKVGDVITRIESESTQGMAALRARDLTRGPSGTAVRLTLRRGQDEREVRLTRGRIPGAALLPVSRITLELASEASVREVVELKLGSRSFQKQGEFLFKPSP